MAKKEAKTDLWVHDLLIEAGIELDAQGSEIKELNEALKTASKRGTGKVGFPEYVGIVKDYILVIEDKATLENHIKYNSDKIISLETKDVTDYAVNGALFYAKHLISNTTYKKIFAFGISGNAKNHRITPIFVDDRLNVFDKLEDVESFISFNEKNIDEYYLCDVLKESSDKEKELEEILSDAKVLHEHLRNYGNMKDEEKPLVVSGILLALRERDNGNFSIDSLNADTFITDGQKIFNAIESSFKRTDLSPVTKIDKILSQFSIIKDSTKLNEKNPNLGETPLKFFTKFLDEKLYKSIKYTRSAEDYLGRFYGEFMRYSGGSGQTLGIVLTPRHITELFCDLLDLKTTDRIFDPCCGTGGFLVAALHTMLSKSSNENEKVNIRKNQLYGIEIRPDMFTVATTNMILRGDGKSNLHCDDFLSKNPKQLQTDFRATVGMLNPPYSQGTKEDPSLYEIAFTEHLLDSLLPNSRCAVIVQQSSVTGKTKEEQLIKESILKKHTLEGTIMLQKDTFYGIGVTPCIAIFTTGIPHNKEKISKFINFEDDGFKVSPHIGLLETESAKDKKQHLLDVWFDRIETNTKFCVKTTVTADDEWLHSFYYFNDEIPIEKDFEKTVGDYLSFEFSMIMQGRKYLFEDEKNSNIKKNFKFELMDKNWREFFISGDEGVFKIEATSSGIDKNKLNLEFGDVPYITRSDASNGVNLFVSEKQTLGFNKDLGNCITIGLDTQTVFYQPHDFYTGQNIQVLTYENCTKENALFIVRLIQLQMVKFNWGGNGATLGRLSRTKVLLPVDSNGKIDFEFMESYIKEIEKNKIEEYNNFILKRLDECCSTKKGKIESIAKKEWKTFEIAKLFNKFEQGKSKGLNHLDENDGVLPYLGATNKNNGVLTFIKEDEILKQKGNCIGFIRNGQGSVGYAIYKSEDFVSTSDNTFAYAEWLNKFTGLFIVTAQDLIRSKYSFGYKRNNTRLKKDKILLPVNSEGKPDFDFMEEYIKNLMYKKYIDYLYFKKSNVEYEIKSNNGLMVAEP
ncbi:MAG: N-6 DNA methylase [Treponema sp.]|nr:N-6 DNA methylase [Treponema sp.]